MNAFQIYAVRALSFGARLQYGAKFWLILSKICENKNSLPIEKQFYKLILPLDVDNLTVAHKDI